MLFLSGSRIAYAIVGEDIVRKVQSRYNKATGLSLRFERVFHWKLADKVQHFQGAFYLKKPDHFRLETTSQVIVTDGKTMWIYAPPNRQVLIKAYRKGSGMSGAEEVLNAFSKDYIPTYLRDERVKNHLCHVLLLRPREPGSYIQKVTVTIKPKAKAIPGDYLVSLTALGKEDKGTMELRVTVGKPVTWGWVGIGIVLAVVIALIGVFIKLGRR